METEFATFAPFATPKPETPYARVRPISNDVASVASVAKRAEKPTRPLPAAAPWSWPARAAVPHRTVRGLHRITNPEALEKIQ